MLTPVDYDPVVACVWATPDADALVAHMARVSADPSTPPKTTDAQLIRWLWKEGHVSPFEMVNLCVEFYAPRDVTRQFIRHRINVQEFSGRYAVHTMYCTRQTRMKHPTNRQMSVSTDDETLKSWHHNVQADVLDVAVDAYEGMLKRGIAKEVARAVLPEGMVISRMFANGRVREWIHYLNARTDHGTVMREHVHLAEAIKAEFIRQFPVIAEAVWGD